MKIRPEKQSSAKYKQIDKNQAVIFFVLAATSFIVVLSAFSAYSLFVQQRYQSSVISEKEQSLADLERSYENASDLSRAYAAFADSPDNIIGGFSEGDGERAGDNARIILDALPSQYDFPAFITSVEQLLLRQEVSIDSISGSDQELEFRDIEGGEPIEVPLGVSFNGDYASVQAAIDSFESSIRPFSFNSIALSGRDDSLRVDLRGHSYFQPSQPFELNTRPINP